MRPVLVLDGHSRAAVEAIQSLGRRGIRVHAAGIEGSACFGSRYPQRKLIQPSPADHDSFITWLRELDAADAYQLIIPSTEASLQAIRSLPVEDSLYERCQLPVRESLDIALSKDRTTQLAKEIGIPVPQTRNLDTASSPPSDFPVVLKPVRSKVVIDGKVCARAPILVADEQRWRKELSTLLQVTPVIEQEYVLGNGWGVEALYERGVLRWFFCHERLHEGETRQMGSGSQYRCSRTPPSELLTSAKNILNALSWHGVAMVEFKRNEAGGHWLIEINPRLWGSLAVAIDAGADFPWGLYLLSINAKIGPQPNYRRPFYTRALYDDVMWIANRASEDGSEMAKEVLKLFRPLLFRESWDHFDWRDLGPTLEELNKLMRRVGGVVLQRLGHGTRSEE